MCVDGNVNRRLILTPLMMVDTHHKQGAEVRMAEGIVYRRCLASETRLSNKTNSRKKKTGEVVLNELTMNRMIDLKNLLPPISTGRRNQMKSQRNKRRNKSPKKIRSKDAF